MNQLIEQESECTYELISEYFPGNFNGCKQQGRGTRWKCAVNRPQAKEGGNEALAISQNPFFPNNSLLRLSTQNNTSALCEGNEYHMWDPICFAVYNCNFIFSTNGNGQFNPKYDYFADASTGTCEMRVRAVEPCEKMEAGCKPEAKTLGCAGTLDVGVTQSLRNEDLRVRRAKNEAGWEKFLEDAGGMRPVKVSSAQEYVPLNLKNSTTRTSNTYKPGFEPDFLIVNYAVRYTAGEAGRAGPADIADVLGIYNSVHKDLFCCDQEVRSSEGWCEGGRSDERAAYTPGEVGRERTAHKPRWSRAHIYVPPYVTF